MLKFILIVCLMALAEATCTLYFKKANENKAVQSGLWCATTIMLSSFITINYVKDTHLIIAAMIGAFLGTFFIVKYFPDKKEDK